jgi:hypothetical protein
MAASKLMIDAVDELYAVWDGEPHDLTAEPPTWWRTPASAARQCRDLA